MGFLNTASLIMSRLLALTGMIVYNILVWNNDLAIEDLMMGSLLLAIWIRIDL